MTSVMIAIGKVYDERLEIAGVNFSIILSVFYVILFFPMLFSIRAIQFTLSKVYLYAFLALILFSPILWGFHGVTEYGIEKYINFVVIIIPLILVSSRFEYKDVLLLLHILLYFVFFLALLGSIKLGGSVERLSVLGGGPIIFARWMIIGSIIIFFLKNKNIKNFLLITLLILLSIAAGSRGPIFSLLFTIFIFLLLNFQKILFRLLVVLFLIGGILLVIDASFILDIGKADRLITRDSTSKNVRMKFANRSLELIALYPMGVGIGNWQEYCNKTQPYHLLRHEYPHNLILEVFAELGILGGVILLILIVKALYFTFFRMLKYSHQNSIYELFFYLQVFLLINSMFSGSLNDSRLFLIVIAISLIPEPLVHKNIVK